jgi:exodeoxyribonuclease VII large subunit
LSYHSVLDRGFALIKTADGKPVGTVGALPPGAAISIELKDGTRQATIAGTRGKPRGSDDAQPRLID